MNKKGYSYMEVIDFFLPLFIVPKEQSIKLLIMRVWMLTFLAHLVRAFNNGKNKMSAKWIQMIVCCPKLDCYISTFLLTFVYLSFLWNKNAIVSLFLTKFTKEC